MYHEIGRGSSLKLYEHYHRQMRDCDEKIEACLGAFADKSGGEVLTAKPRARGANAVAFDARTLLFNMAGVDVTGLEGISELSALTVLSEIGTDMSRFLSAKNFVSWLGLCPNHRGSAGKIFNCRVRKGANRAARALRLAGQACHHAKNALGAFYRRIQARCGGPKAVTATARKIAERIYRLLKYGEEYVRQGEKAYEEAYRVRTLKALADKAQSLGYQLTPLTTA